MITTLLLIYLVIGFSLTIWSREEKNDSLHGFLLYYSLAVLDAWSLYSITSGSIKREMGVL